MAQLVQHLTLGFSFRWWSQGHKISPASGSVLSTELASDSLSLFLCPSHLCAISLKNVFKKYVSRGTDVPICFAELYSFFFFWTVFLTKTKFFQKSWDNSAIQSQHMKRTVITVNSQPALLVVDRSPNSCFLDPFWFMKTKLGCQHIKNH